MVVGFVDILKSPTLTVKMLVCLIPPPVAVIETVYVLGAIVEVLVTFNVELEEPLLGRVNIDGFNIAVGPPGWVDGERVTVPAKLFVEVTVTVAVLENP